MQLLLKKGANVEASIWENPWHEEVDETGSEKEVKPLSGRPLGMAASKDSHEIIQLLVEDCADVEATDWAFGMSALHIAVATPARTPEGSIEAEKTICLLLECGAELNARTQASKEPTGSDERWGDRNIVTQQITVLQIAVFEDKTRYARIVL